MYRLKREEREREKEEEEEEEEEEETSNSIHRLPVLMAPTYPMLVYPRIHNKQQQQQTTPPHMVRLPHATNAAVGGSLKVGMDFSVMERVDRRTW